MSYNLGNTEAMSYNGAEVDKLTLDGVIIWESVNASITGTAVYNPVTKSLTYSVTIGEKVTKWSYQSVRQSDSSDTGEIFINSPTTTKLIENLTKEHDGAYNITFKSYVDSEHVQTDTTTVTITTPFIEIVSVEEMPL